MIKNNIFIGNTTLIIIYDTVPIFWSWESCLLKLLFEISRRFDRIASVLPSILPDFFGYFFSKYTCKAFCMIFIVFFVNYPASGLSGSTSESVKLWWDHFLQYIDLVFDQFCPIRFLFQLAFGDLDWSKPKSSKVNKHIYLVCAIGKFYPTLRT